jgi:hypothetical protein
LKHQTGRSTPNHLSISAVEKFPIVKYFLKTSIPFLKA